MADEGMISGAGDDVARLVALTERQHELWGLLREAKDEDERNRLFDELTNNREELARLKDAVSAQVDAPRPSPIPQPKPQPQPQPQPKPQPNPQPNPQPPQSDEGPRSVGEQLRSKILSPETTAPSTPPPPPSPPATQAPPPPPASPPPAIPPPQAQPEPMIVEKTSTEPKAEPEFEPELPVPTEPDRAATIPREEESAPAPQPPPKASTVEPATTYREVPEGDLSPERTPYRSREADLAAMRGAEPTQPSRPQQRPVADKALEQRRRSAHEAYQEMARVRPQPSRTWPIFAIMSAVFAVAAVAWFLLFFDNGGESAEPPATSTTTSIPETESIVDQIQAVVDGMAVGSIVVEERDGTIYLFGAVASENDRAAVAGASQALAGTTPVDSAGLTLQTSDDELRAAALAAVAAAGFDKINVSVVGGVATLTGVTPDGGSADLVNAVAAVDGISQAVDLTESVDRAAALENELNRITAVTPLIFDNGQIDPDELHEQILDRVAESITAYGGPTVTVVGYTDASGATEENEQISLIRAERVVDYLVAQGVPAERLEVEGRGESDSSGSSAVAGLERRVEFEVGYVVAAGGDAAFRIGIVAPSARNDLAFTQSIVEAANLVAAENGGIGIDVSDNLFVVDEAEAALRSYAADGYDLVIAHGSQYGTALSSLAQEFPNTAFAWGTAADTFGLDNVSSYEVAADEGGYVLGVIAANISDTGVVGVVGPIEVGDAQLFVNGFRNGAIATDPGVDILVTYTGSFSDVAMAADTASAHVGNGADVLTGSSQMVVGAVGVAVENDAAWLGNQANQTLLAPDLVVASQVYHWEVALREIVDGIDQGVLGGSAYTLTLDNGGVVIEYNDGYALPDGVLTEAEETQSGIIAGTVATGI